MHELGASEMTAHALLLTGVPGVGKTTIVSKVAAGLSGRRNRGFVTDEIREGERRVGFEIRTFGGKTRTLAHVDLRSRHRVGRYGVDVEALDEIAESALVLDDETEVYLVDEIGKMECFSERFCTAMTTLLDAGRPVIATIARHGGGFISEVKRRRDIELWAATRDNRGALPRRMPERTLVYDPGPRPGPDRSVAL